MTAVAPDLRRLFQAQTLTSGPSGWLADTFVKKFGKRGGADGLVNYESVLLSLNAGEVLSEPLTVVTPADGVVTADYPLTLLSGADEPTRDAYAVLTGCGRRPAGPRAGTPPSWPSTSRCCPPVPGPPLRPGCRPVPRSFHSRERQRSAADAAGLSSRAG